MLPGSADNRSMRLRFVLLLVACLAHAQNQALPRGFQEYRLGMSLQEVKEALRRDANFRYRGDPDVTFLLRPNTNLIDVEGGFFIRRGFFQFREERLVILTLELHPQRLDYFSLFTTLSKKYGEPTRLDPSGAFWENEEVLLSLEKPLTVKYQDRQMMEELRQAARTEQTLQALTRERFMDQF